MDRLPFELLVHLVVILLSLLVWLKTYRLSLTANAVLFSIRGGFKWAIILYVGTLFMMGCSLLKYPELEDGAIFQGLTAIFSGLLTNIALLFTRMVAFHFLGKAFKDDRVESPATLLLGVVILLLAYSNYVGIAIDILFWMVSL